MLSSYYDQGQGARMQEQRNDETASPLITNGILLKVTAFICGLAMLTAGVTIAGKYYGDRLAMDGHTLSGEIFHIQIGQDVISLPANMIRFENQRKTGEAEVINSYLSWPEMQGYTAGSALRFSNPRGAQDLIFIELSQSVMSRDMSGRLEPIYNRLFMGEPEKGPAGLIMHRLDPKSGFGQEVIFTGTMKTGSLYVLRCLMPENPASATSSDCQRDIHVGRDLTLLYRFSSILLPQWEAIEGQISSFATTHIHE